MDTSVSKFADRFLGLEDVKPKVSKSKKIKPRETQFFNVPASRFTERKKYFARTEDGPVAKKRKNKNSQEKAGIFDVHDWLICFIRQ